MTFSLTPEDVLKSTETSKKPYAIGLVILLSVALLGLVLILSYAASQRETEKLAVQQVMGGVADVRVGAVDSWVRQQQTPLARFADDQDVRLSVTQVLEPSADLDLSSRGYLRNWLASLARNNDYLPPEPVGDVPANVESQSHTGMAIIAKNGDVLVSVGSFPNDSEAVKAYLQSYTPSSPRLIDLFKGSDEKIYVGFSAPLYGINGAQDESSRLGVVIGIKQAADELWPLLGQPGSMLKTGEALLLRAQGGAVEIASPAGDYAPLTQKYDLHSSALVEAKALAEPNSFAIGRNYAGVDTLSVSRTVPNTPWMLSFQASYAELLMKSQNRITYQVMIFLALLAAVIALLYGTWRRGTARIAAEKAVEYAGLARKFDFQGQLLRLVTDSQRNHIMIADTEGRVRFANATLAKDMGTTSEDMIGKPMAAAVGAENARRFAKRAQEATLSNKAVITVDRVLLDENSDKVRVVQTQHIPLEDKSGDAPAHGTLIVEEDITDLVMEREKRERVLRGVVNALVSVVDRRDPYAAEHSGRVAKIGRMIAGEMNLSDIDCDTVEMAGALLNLGKLLVPAQLLTKQTALDEAELRVVRDSLLASADIVSKIEFEGAVVETMRQSMEKVDGSGFPKGLAGDAILVTARIVAAANTFVALISPRAHRAGLPLDTALDKMLDQADHTLDRGVVAALVGYIDNKGGRGEWESLAAPAKSTDEDNDNPWQR